MDHHSHLTALGTGSAGLAAAARKGGLHVTIAACPGWCMADLVWHTATYVHMAARAMPMRAGVVTDEVLPIPEQPPDEALIDWLQQGCALLAAALVEHDPDDTVGQRCPPGYPGPSLYRHFAREVDVHRFDAEQAIGIVPTIDDELAADWLDALLIAWLPAAGQLGNQAQGPWTGQSLRFTRTDGEGEWLVRLHGAGVVEAARGPVEAHADLTAAGTGSALLLLALNRVPPTYPGVHLAGDADLMARWAKEVRYGRPAAGPHWLGSPRPRHGTNR